MRVLMISKACVVGAYQRKLEEMVRQAPDLTLCVLVPPSWRDPARGELRLERAHVRGYELRVTPIRFNGNFHLHHYPRLGRELRDFQPDLVHIDEEPYNLATWQALWHARRVGARTLFFTWQNIARRYPPPFSWGERWVLRHADCAIAGTQGAAEVWRVKGYHGPLAVIPQFGVDPEAFSPSPAPHPNDEFVIGFAGRLVKEKGGAWLLESLARLDGRWRLLVAGEGPQRPALIAQAQRLGIAARVTFETHTSTEMPAFYRQLDALVVPSLTRPNWKEQFGRVIVEAMACGVPVIGSSSGAIPDVIGEDGLIVPEGDVSALTAALRRLMTAPDLRQELGQRGRARVLACYTQAQVAAQTVTVYRRVLEAV